MIKLYNSLTNKIEEFKPLKENEVSMYVCGPTVYNYAHIGNTRPMIFFDVVNRFFQYMGYKVTYISNYTDIDDKIIKKAQEENVDESVISNRYIKAYEEVRSGLNCLPLAATPQVTKTMDEIINFIQDLVEKGDAYQIDSDVYFDISRAKEYGVLSGQSIENLMVGARIDENVKKHTPMDFALWKATTVGKKWSSPWGEGRPGWHTECVVMIHNYFKGMIDIHGGGLDLKFPHHDNEIAQSGCMYDNHIANYWIHNGLLDIRGEKMSKSLGNVILACDFLKEVGYTAYRLMTLNVPYRQPLNIADELISQAVNDANKIRKAYVSLYRMIELNYHFRDCEIENEELLKLKKEFTEAMSNDFNTANGLTVLYKVIKLINQTTRMKDADELYLNQLLKLYNEILFVFGLDQKLNTLTDEEKELVNKWQEARKNKDFALADIYRNQINELGLEL